MQPDDRLVPRITPGSLLRHDTAVTPHLGPEPLRMIDRPMKQPIIVDSCAANGVDASRLRNLLSKMAQVRSRHCAGRWAPKGEQVRGQRSELRGQRLKGLPCRVTSHEYRVTSHESRQDDQVASQLRNVSGTREAHRQVDLLA